MHKTEGCKFIHDFSNREMENGKLKKEILCRFVKNCKHGSTCEYYHPITQKKTTKAKNWEEEMYKNVHFLSKQMKQLTESMNKMKMNQGRK